MKTSEILKKHLLILVLMGLLPLLSTAQGVTQQRDTPEFTAVDATGIFTVYITQDNEFSVILEAEENQLQHIETKVSNGTLKLRYTGKGRINGQLNAYVSAPMFSKLSASGAVTVRGETLLQSPELEVSLIGASNIFLDMETEKLTSSISGASNATYTGYATTHKLSVSGASVMRALDLQTQSTDASVSGASTARVNASEFLKGNASGTSTLIYKERPLDQDLRTSGLSSIRSENGATARSNEQDTVRVRIGEREVHVIERDGSHRWGMRKTREHTFKGNWGGFELGINGYMTPDNDLEVPQEYDFLDLKYEKSIAVNINMFQQNFNLISNNLGLVTGLGLGWNNYRFSNTVIPVQTPTGIEVADPNPEYGYIKSKMTLLYLNVPLMMEFQTRSSQASQRFHIAGGVVGGLRLRSHTKQVYNTNGNKNKDKTYDDFHVNPFRLDATARIGWGSFSLFGNYSLTTLFRDDRGPELYPFTIGIRVLRW